MKRLIEESYDSYQESTIRRVSTRFISQDCSLIYTLSEDCFTTILNALLIQPTNIDGYLDDITDIYVYVLKFVCVKLHHICHKFMSNYCAIIKCQLLQKEINPFTMLESFLIQNERNLSNWFINLEKFPKVLDQVDDIADTWQFAAYSGNKNVLIWCTTKYPNIKWFSSAITGAVEGNQIDILNWGLDHFEDEDDNCLDAEIMKDLILKTIKNGNTRILERLMTHVKTDKFVTQYIEGIMVKTKIGKDENSPIYLYTIINISELFECAAKNNRINILNWINRRGLLNLPFWQIEEKKRCIQDLISNFKKSLSIETLDLLNFLL
jgi:hypothetical protein